QVTGEAVDPLPAPVVPGRGDGGAVPRSRRHARDLPARWDEPRRQRIRRGPGGSRRRSHPQRVHRRCRRAHPGAPGQSPRYRADEISGDDRAGNAARGTAHADACDAPTGADQRRAALGELLPALAQAAGADAHGQPGAAGGQAMSAPTPGVDPTRLDPYVVVALEKLAARESALIALDFDGCLAPLVDDPAEARPLPEAAAALEELSTAPDLDLALISGRPAADLIDLATPPANTWIISSHGAEIGRVDGEGEFHQED